MAELFLEYYLFIKALHILAVISWMAGMLYLPRLYVYHTRVNPGSEAYELFKTMEEKLLRIIITPAMIASWVFGCMLLYAQPELLSMLWMQIKLVALVPMQYTYYLMVVWCEDFVKGENKHSENFYRAFNEAPTILMIIIVIMAVMKPFQ